MTQQMNFRGVIDSLLEQRRNVFGASLQDTDEGKPLVMKSLGDRLVQNIRDPVDGLGNERRIGDPERNTKGVDRL